jgi:hypothetical protein
MAKKCERYKHRWLLLPKSIGEQVRFSWCTKCGILRLAKLSNHDKTYNEYRAPSNGEK